MQQDGAPSHYAHGVCRCLDEILPTRWMGKRGAPEWSARSPHLTHNQEIQQTIDFTYFYQNFHNF